MRLLPAVLLIALGCAPSLEKRAALLEQTLDWPTWVARAFTPFDDRMEILPNSVTRHTSTRMACAGTYSCFVGWRGSEPAWIECEVETQLNLWSCIHSRQPRPRFRFHLAEGRIVSWDSLTPWIEASIERVASGFGDWNPFQVCGGEWNSRGEYVLDVMGSREDEEWTVRSVTTVRASNGSWVTRE